MDTWQTATNAALRRAFECRNRLSIARNEPVSVFDVCDQIGIDIRFLNCKSLEGMYCRSPRLSILLPSSQHRPRGRIAFSCAHELGHHELGHGTRADKYIAGPRTPQRREPEELGADVFAAHFLMPRQAVLHALKIRGWDLASITSRQAFTLAGQFGVGYETFLSQLVFGLKILSQERSQILCKVQPKAIRHEILPAAAATDLIIVDSQWQSVPADLEIGDFLITESDAVAESPTLKLEGHVKDQCVWSARAAGQTRICQSGTETLIRVARRAYAGAWRYRFLPEEDG